MKNDKIYLPTAIQWLSLPLVTLLLLAVLNIDLISKRFFFFFNGDITKGYVSMLGYYLNNNAINDFGVVLFWMVVGGTSYLITAGLVVAVNLYRSDIPMQSMLSSNQGLLDEQRKITLLRIALRSIALVALFIWVIFAIAKALPYLQGQFVLLVTEASPLAALSILILGLFTLFVPIFLIRLFLLRKRVFQT